MAATGRVVYEESVADALITDLSSPKATQIPSRRNPDSV
jgi:hypothetical protein